MHLLLFHGPGAAWVFWEALGTPDGSRPTKKERVCLKIWALFAKMGSILEPPFFRNRPLGFQNGRPMIQYGHFLEPKGGPGLQKVAFWGAQKRCRKLCQKTMDLETLSRRKWCSRVGAVRILQKGDVLKTVPKRSQNGAKIHAKSDQRRPRTPKERPGGDFDTFWCASRAAPCPKKRVRKMTPKMDPSKIEILGL